MSLINTRIQNVRAKGNLDKYETRPSRYGALNLFLQQSQDPAGIITQELRDKALKSIGNTFETPVIDFDGDVSIGNVRSVTVADDENTSQVQTITFATYAWGFTSVPAMFMNNEIGMQQDFERKFLKYLYKFGEVLDTAGVAALEAAKSEVFEDSLDYTVTGNTLISGWKKRDLLIGDLNPIMAANDFFSDLHLLGNGGLESIINKLKQSGVYNADNKQLEYLDKILHFTSRLSNSEGEYANMFAVNGGSVGMLTRFDREAIMGTKMADGTEWGIDTLPMLNFPIGTYFYESKGDFNAIAGAATADMKAVRKEHYGFSVDVAFVTPYNSDSETIASPIVKATVNAETAADYPQVVIANTEANPVFTDEIPAGS